MAATPIRGRTLSHWQRKIELQKWAVLGGRFGKLATCYWVSAGYVPRFTPPEGSFVNFLAQMTNTVLRSRRENFVPRRIGRATRPPAPIVLSTRQEGLVRPMMVWAHDLRCIPTSLANKIPAASNSRGGYRGGKTVPPRNAAQPAPRHELPSLVEILALLKFRRSCATIYGGFRPG